MTKPGAQTIDYASSAVRGSSAGRWALLLGLLAVLSGAYILASAATNAAWQHPFVAKTIDPALLALPVLSLCGFVSGLRGLISRSRYVARSIAGLILAVVAIFAWLPAIAWIESVRL